LQSIEKEKICPNCNSRNIQRDGFVSNKFQRFNCKDCGRDFQIQHSKWTWSKSEEDYLRKNYKWGSKSELKKNLKKTWKQIQTKANKLRLRRLRRGNQPIIEIENEKFNFYVNKYGYILLWNPELGIEAKFAHRYIWEKHKGEIPPGYRIHHKDGNPQNNSIENLSLVKSTSHHHLGSISQLCQECFKTAFEKGFWDLDVNGRPTRNIGDALMKIVSEVGEAEEAYRHGDFEHLTEELVDTLIRIFDLAGGLGLDLETKLTEKMEFNKGRPYKHGKLT